MVDIPLQPNPIERLFVIAETLRRDAEALELGDWLLGALQQHVKDAVPLERALGLSGGLGRSAAFRYHYARRKACLAAALKCCNDDYALLAGEADRFEKRLWPIYRDGRKPPSDWPPVRVALHAAFQIGISVPKTAEGLRKAIGN